MVFDGNVTRNKSETANEGTTVETALDWFCRSQRQNRRKRRLSGSSCNGVGNDNGISDDLYADIPTDPSIAAWNFLQFGKSGIAPIDEAWKRSCDGTKGRGQRRPGSPLLLPPVTILEGPKDVGKTWMVLTLAARFVVATRASRFKDFNNNGEGKGICTTTTDEMQSRDTGSGGSNVSVDDDENGNRNKNSDQPIVVLADSTYDFTMSQLVTVVRMTLSRERKRQQLRETNTRNIQPPDGSDNDKQYNADRQCQNSKINERTIEEELDCQERERISFKQDMEDCLSRIHVIQVDNGSIDWVPMLEALTYQLDDNRRRHDTYASVINSGRSWHMEASTKGPPTLLLWDGFLSDMAFSPNVVTSGIIGDSIGNYNTVQATFENPGTQELLRQVSRLLQKHPDTLWLVLTTRTVSVTSTATAHATASNGYKSTATEYSGIGLRMTEWVRKEEERRLREKHAGSSQDRHLQNRYPSQQPIPSQRASYRIRLDRRHDSCVIGEDRIPSTTAAAMALFAKVLNNGDADKKIPYSISLGGILS